MNTPVALERFLISATTIICNGYEIDGVFEKKEQNVYHLYCADDLITIVKSDAPVTLDSDGQCTVVDEYGESAEFEFRISRPMTHKDL